MSAPATAYRRLPSRQHLGAFLDVALAAALLAGSLVMLIHAARIGLAPSHHGAGRLSLAGVLLGACATVPLVAWRRFPLGVFAVTTAASATLAALGFPVHLLLSPTAALYLLTSGRPARTPWTPRTTATVIGLLVAGLGAATAARGRLPGPELFAFTGLVWAAAWLAGERTRLRRERLAELEQRALRAERDAERERLLAAAEERARIARDLHDSAAHAISVIAVRAGAARLRHRQDPDRTLPALEAIEGLARQTVDEIDQIVGTLRNGPAGGAVEAPPGLASLDTLIAQHQAAGLEVALETSGAPRRPADAFDQAAYRILQEALTNAARHGAGSARVELGFGDTAVQLGVTNPIPAAGPPRPGGGHGLVGMRERATLLGGSLEAGPSGRVFRVHARIPYGGQRA